MLLLGIDIGTSFIKVSVIDSGNLKTVAEAQYPDTEETIITPYPGWAEQAPGKWWIGVQEAIRRCNNTNLYDPLDIGAIGIAYQMHGLVVADNRGKVLRNAIIWSDSRTIEIGKKAFREIGEDFCLSHLLNAPGNFTSSKLAWVKQNEPGIYKQIDKVMLPGDFIAFEFTGQATTTPSALSEGVFWDFSTDSLSEKVLNYFGFEERMFPNIQPVFSVHGYVLRDVASHLGLRANIPVTYKAGDQPNNALSLNVMRPGEVAATAGTSGVIYGVADKLTHDVQSRINSFVHVNHTAKDKRVGVLLNINGAGIFNRWIKMVMGASISYQELNSEAAAAPPGAEGLIALPFGNGAERMLNNRWTGAQFRNIDLNIHARPHLARAVQEGLAFAFRYGLDIMRENGIHPKIIRAGKSNMFLSPVFLRSFVNATGVAVELHETNGSVGAAIGAGIGAGLFSVNDLSPDNTHAEIYEPDDNQRFNLLYQNWKTILEQELDNLKQASYSQNL